MTEGADCLAIGDRGIFEKLIKQYKAESEDCCILKTSLNSRTRLASAALKPFKGSL